MGENKHKPRQGALRGEDDCTGKNDEGRLSVDAGLQPPTDWNGNGLQ